MSTRKRVQQCRAVRATSSKQKALIILKMNEMNVAYDDTYCKKCTVFTEHGKSEKREATAYHDGHVQRARH